MANLVTDKLVSLQCERHFLSSLVKYPEILYEVDSYLKTDDFVNSLHSVIYSIARQEILAGNTFDKVILAQKISALNISTRDEISPFDYVSNLYDSQINKSGGLNASKELIRLRVHRKYYNDGLEIQKFVVSPEALKMPISEVTTHIDSIVNKSINDIYIDDVPTDLFLDAKEKMDERASNPTEDIGIQTNFKLFNATYGGLRPGVTAICGRAKHNKSTYLSNMSWGALINNENLNCLYLDSEMKKDTNQFRALSAFSQVPMHFLETGKWALNQEFVEKVNDAQKMVNKLKGRFYHYYIGNKSIEHVNSVIRKWYFSKCGRGNPALIVYDYIKIGNEKLSGHNQEHQALGQKINLLNEISQQLNIPILSGMQLNRSAITDARDDESAISMTDRLSWFANTVCILRKKRPEEIAEEGINFGTHKLINVVTRFMGKDGGNFDLVKVSEDHGKPKYKINFINYQFSNFLLTEKGTLRDIVQHQNFTKPLDSKIQDNNNKDTDF